MARILGRGPSYGRGVPEFRISEAADLLGVSDDTVRRWVDAGRLPATRTGGRWTVAGTDLARIAQELAEAPGDDRHTAVSARNQLRGIVTRVLRDTVMAQVDVQAGPYRLVSLISREAADDLGLEPGVVVTAGVKATNLMIERH